MTDTILEYRKDGCSQATIFEHEFVLVGLLMFQQDTKTWVYFRWIAHAPTRHVHIYLLFQKMLRRP